MSNAELVTRNFDIVNKYESFNSEIPVCRQAGEI